MAFPAEPDLPAGAQSPDSSGRDDFPATRWSLVLTASSGDAPAARRALAELCGTYWYPLYAYVRRQGFSPEDAEDRTQDFFQSLIQRGSLASVESGRGKLRSFLLGGIKNSLINNFRHQNAAKRGGGVTVFSIDQAQAEARFDQEPSHEQHHLSRWPYRRRHGDPGGRLHPPGAVV